MKAIIIFFIYSFFGWIYEVILEFIYNNRFSNRGFLTLPIIPIYGFTSIILINILTPLKDNILLVFLLAALLSTIIEYNVSLIMEKIFHLRYWDYRNKPLNLNGRICLEASLIFGFLGTITVIYLNPFLLSLIAYIELHALIIIDTLLIVITTIDFFINYYKIRKIKNTKKMKGDCTNKIKKMSKNSF